LLHLRLLFRLEARSLNLAGLKAEQVKLLGIGLLINDQRGLLGVERGAPADEVREGLALGIEVSKGVQDRKLAGGMQQRLVLVRAVDIHQPLAQGGQDVQCRRGAVDELAVGARAGEGALQDKLVVGARLEAVFLQE
jgi:predicted lysophospholipase L1 biosynthesis ABC-type transport system permease subunit